MRDVYIPPPRRKRAHFTEAPYRFPVYLAVGLLATGLFWLALIATP